MLGSGQVVALVNRRGFFVVAFGTVMMWLGFSAEEQSPPSKAIEWAKESDLSDQLDTLESALDDLDSNIDDFDDENWQDTVPAVRDAADDVRKAFEALKEQING